MPIIEKLENKLKRFYYKPKYYKWFFFGTILVLTLIYNYQKILFLRPQSVHQWRQCDCLSMTMCYYADNNSFFNPSVYNLGNDGTGKTISEFPIIYFFVAQLWKIFGHHEFIFRLLNISIFVFALFSLFRLMEDLFKDSFWSISLALLLFTSPILVYYTNNFLSNVPAFSFAIMGLCCFGKFYKTNQDKYLYFFALFFVIAGLLKITSSVTFIAIAIIFLLEQFYFLKFKNGEKLFQHPRKQIIPFLLVAFVLPLWYIYAHQYNSHYNSGMFLIGTLPIWDLNTEQIHRIFLGIKDNLRWNYFRPIEQLLLVAQLILILAYWRKTNKLMLWLTNLTAIGFFCFILLFFQVLDVHDYYAIDFLILMPIITFTFLLTLKKWYSNIFNSVIVRILFVAFIIHNADFARRRMDGRYDTTELLNRAQTKYSYAFGDITPYLRNLGINRKDKVICFPDSSINITLYLMDQKGWTNYNLPIDSMKIKEKILMGAKYLFVYDNKLNSNSQLQPFLKYKVGSYKIVDIYKL